jgi:hypothetical protein
MGDASMPRASLSLRRRIAPSANHHPIELT